MAIFTRMLGPQPGDRRRASRIVMNINTRSGNQIEAPLLTSTVEKVTSEDFSIDNAQRNRQGVLFWGNPSIKDSDSSL